MTPYIVGTASTAFRKWPDRDFRSLVAEVFDAVVADAGLSETGLTGPGAVDQVLFANCAMGVWGQDNIRGQGCLAPQQRAGRLAPYAPIINVEGGCATGSLALHGAVQAIRGGADLVLAVGVEKTWVPDDPAKSFALFAGGIDQRHPEEWQALFARAGEESGCGWKPHPARIMFLDVHALQARDHMKRFGTTVEQIAAVAAKNHHHGALNPKAQYRFEVPVEKVLADRAVVAPLTRSMCAPISDGAAAALIASPRWLARQTEAVRARALEVRACALGGGRMRDIDEPSVVAHTAQKAYAQAGLGPEAIEVAEVHDATAFCEILHYEALGFAAEGEGGAYATSGAAEQGGARPVNLSGGLISKGHPLGATGLGMVDEVAAQLRGEAGDRQASNAPTVGLVQNAGGLVSFDEALCGVSILARG